VVESGPKSITPDMENNKKRKFFYFYSLKILNTKEYSNANIVRVYYCNIFKIVLNFRTLKICLASFLFRPEPGLKVIIKMRLRNIGVCHSKEDSIYLSELCLYSRIFLRVCHGLLLIYETSRKMCLTSLNDVLNISLTV
jgi:hypothetical protein